MAMITAVGPCYRYLHTHSARVETLLERARRIRQLLMDTVGFWNGPWRHVSKRAARSFEHCNSMHIQWLLKKKKNIEKKTRDSEDPLLKTISN